MSSKISKLGRLSTPSNPDQLPIVNGDTTKRILFGDLGAGVRNLNTPLTASELQVNGNLNVDGNLTVSTLISSSTLYDSGSTIFGNTIDDTHQFTGSVFISGSVENVDYIDFLVDGTPNYKEGRLYYDSAEGALSFYNYEADISLQIGQEFYVKVKNATSNTILNGTPVKITGAAGNNVLVTPAIAPIHTGSAVYENHILGLATHDIAGDSQGFVCAQGLVRGVDTDGYSAGDILFLQTGSDSTAKSYLTNQAPPFPYDDVQVGYVRRVQQNEGVIFVEAREPVHFDNLSGISGSAVGTEGSLLVKQEGNYWGASLDLKGNYSITGSLQVTGSTSVTNLLNLAPIHPLPAGNVGDLAVSGSDLYFYNGSWSQVSLI